MERRINTKAFQCGDVISFLIGGGCDHLTEYVELLVDGFVTMRATGRCNERMERIE